MSDAAAAWFGPVLGWCGGKAARARRWSRRVVILVAVTVSLGSAGFAGDRAATASMANRSPLTAAAGAAVKAGSPCTKSKVGTSEARYNFSLRCTKLVLRSTKRTAYRWLPVSGFNATGLPTGATIFHYGGVAKRSPSDSCLEGTWKFTGAQFNEYFVAVSKLPKTMVRSGVFASGEDFNALFGGLLGQRPVFVDSNSIELSFFGGLFFGTGSVRIAPDFPRWSGEVYPPDDGLVYTEESGLKFEFPATPLLYLLVNEGAPTTENLTSRYMGSGSTVCTDETLSLGLLVGTRQPLR
jgi:hypothetical protein